MGGYNKRGLKLRKSINEETVFYYDIENKKLVLDRSKSKEKFALEYGTQRKCKYDKDELKLQIFVDISSIEVFVNDGEEVFTSRIFTGDESNELSIFADGSAKAEMKVWKIK